MHMTEQEWLECTDPDAMLLFLGDNPSDRKLRLFGCACLRRVWRSLPEDSHRRAIETAERFADGLVTSEELEAAREAAYGPYRDRGDLIADYGALIASSLCSPEGNLSVFGVDGAAAVRAEACEDSEIGWDALHAEERAVQGH